MADQYEVKANVVKVAVGDPAGNRVARILRRGAIVPDGVDESTLKSLAGRRLIAKVTKRGPSAAEKAAAEKAAAEKAAAEKAAAEKAAAEKAAAEKAAGENTAAK
ncbi:hypothetical protein [Microbacterium halophytorum]|uniref:hypothetical protein n=1 Tax=Microbacterium halophytorum TaxID=2067568 RepID=UPI0018E06B6D|nr:hypothetical protein [Microbacterium halophytorum]